MEVNQFLLVQVDPNRIDQLHDQVLYRCVLLLFFLVLEKTVSQKEIVRSFNDQPINVLLVDQSGNERNSSLEPAFDGADGLDKGLFGATDGDSGEDLDVRISGSD